MPAKTPAYTTTRWRWNSTTKTVVLSCFPKSASTKAISVLGPQNWTPLTSWGWRRCLASSRSIWRRRLIVPTQMISRKTSCHKIWIQIPSPLTARPLKKRKSKSINLWLSRSLVLWLRATPFKSWIITCRKTMLAAQVETPLIQII